MLIKNKYNMTPEQDKRYAKTNLSRLISSELIFKGMHFTSAKIETIIFNFEVKKIFVLEIDTIINLKRGWQYVINTNSSLSFDQVKSINRLIK